MKSIRCQMECGRKIVVTVSIFALCSFCSGCITTDANNPYYGQEFRQGVPAMGAALAPFAKPDAPINADRARSMQSLQGLGVLMDLMSH